MTAPAHVVLTVNAAWNAWNFRRPVIAALLEDGLRVTVLAPPDASVPALEAMGCRFVALPMSPAGLNPLQNLALLRRFHAAWRRERPDVVLGYTIKNNVFGALAAKPLGIPFIPNVSGLGTAFLSGRLLQGVGERLYRGAFRTLPTVFFQNEDDRAQFVGRAIVSSGQAAVLPGSGIDLKHFGPAPYPPPGAPPTFLLIARMLRDKGVREFVEAAGIVRQQHPAARFLLLGATDADNRSAFNLAQLRAWERSHGVEYLGAADDVRPHIAAAHCVVLPSYREGLPRTLLEAAAMARPTIATQVPGCRSAVEDGRTGLLCAARSGTALADACLSFLELPREAQLALGQAGRRKIEREFDQAIVVSAYRRAIADAVAREPAR